MSSVCPFLSHTELTELTEKRGPAVILCFPWFLCAFIRPTDIRVHPCPLCALFLYGLLRLTRLSAAVGPASPEGAKDHRRGYHPRVSDAQYTEALKGRKIFRAFSTPFIGSNINGDYYPRLCSLQPFRLLFGRSEFFIFF